VRQSTISRILKRRRWSNKKGQRVGVRQNDELRLNWVADMLRLTAVQPESSVSYAFRML